MKVRETFLSRGGEDGGKGKTLNRFVTYVTAGQFENIVGMF